MNKRTVLIASVGLLSAVMLSLVAILYGGEWLKQINVVTLPVDDARYLYAQAEEYYRLGDTGLAHDIANRATMVKPDSLPAHKLLAAICLKDKRYAEAESTLRRAARLAPADNNIQLGLAMALNGQGHSAEAAEIYEKVLSSPDADRMAREEAQNQLMTLENAGKDASGRRSERPQQNTSGKGVLP